MDQNHSSSPDNEVPRKLVLSDVTSVRVVNSAGLAEYSDGLWRSADGSSVLSFLQDSSGDGCTLSNEGQIYLDGGVRYLDGTTTLAGVTSTDGTQVPAPSRSRSVESTSQIASTAETFSSQRSEQKAGPSGNLGKNPMPEKPSDIADEATPSNFDSRTGYFRAFVKISNGKKVSAGKLRQHLAQFGPLGPYMSLSPDDGKMHSAYAEFKTYEGFQRAQAAGRHALGDVEVRIVARDAHNTHSNGNYPPFTGAGNGPPMPPSPAPTYGAAGPSLRAPRFGGHGGFAGRGKVVSQGLRPSQLRPISTSPQTPSNPGTTSNFSPLPAGSPRAPSSPSYGYTAGSREVLRDGTKFRGVRRPSNQITTEERARLFDSIGHRRGIPGPQPLSPLNPDFDHNAQQATTAAMTVPDLSDDNVVDHYTSHVDATSTLASTAANLPEYQQAYANNPGPQPSAVSPSPGFGDDSAQHTQTAQTSSNTETSNSNSGQRQQQQQQTSETNPSSSQQQTQQSQQTETRPTLNGLDNSEDAFKDDCPIHSPDPCDCGQKFPDCAWPYPCTCNRPSCNPQPPSTALAPAGATTSPPPQSMQSAQGTQGTQGTPPGGYFVIQKRTKGIAIMTPQGEEKVFRREDGVGRGKGKDN
ncbi:hypothetical protein FKW77_005339 [Venturia effusa]|uniref:Uncharacterized protein n=1 Tax=Venturia effusa TaxID=50376 RepID=A0A517LIS0_9PEZI|nr:hypothetical protein FKW77_005339 [Venturia effusa]